MDYSHLDSHIYRQTKLAENPKVSICLITYNHSLYLENCLKNIIEQKVNFEFEVILGEDHSTDDTASIAKKYADAFPELIKAFIRPKNVGPKTNFLHCFLQCKGEYIVFIEGDDYWTNQNKLQKQVDFLDKNPHASACFHNAEILFEDGSNKPNQLINSPNQAQWTYTKDFLKEKETWFMATASVMMRRKFVNPLPKWFVDCKSGDIPMYVILSENGPIGYLSEMMSIYRKNLGGQSFTDSNTSKAFLKNRIFMYSRLNEFTKYQYIHLINPILAEYHELLIHCIEYKGTIFKKIFHFYFAFILQPNKDFKTFSMLFKKNLMSMKALLIYLETRSKLKEIFK
jgi:glycosyltransferase involved in cell wall biosynthesis